jgi:predicted ArsR family transcriptional regulator
MDQSTRKLLALLSNDSTDAICERLGRSPAAKTTLAEELELDPREVASALDSLLLIGIVRYSRGAGKGRGRRPELWRLVAGAELGKLEAYLVAMRHRMLDSEEVEAS